MKNSTGKLISRLIAAIPAAALIRKKENMEASSDKSKTRSSYQFKRDENLNKIFMVRYRIQHL